MGHVDRPPDLVEELRSMKAQIHELQQRVRAAAFLSPVIARVIAGTVSVPNISQATITFTTEQIDTADLWDPGLPDRLTIPRDGVYIVTGFLQFVANATGDRQITVTISSGQGTSALVRAPTDLAQLVATGVAECSAGDTITLSAWQSSGGALNASFSVLAVAWVGVGS